MATSSEPNAEISDLLSQFSSMGTTDRDILIQELFTVLHGQISRNECAFVLEMSNWNLQNAVGTFYDYLGFNPAENFSMKIERIDVEPEGPNRSMTTGSRFRLTWVVINTGSVDWPADARLVYHSGYEFNGILEGPIGNVACGQRKMITVSIFCPSVPGIYCTQMRLKYEGGYFGEILPIQVQAVESNDIGCLTDQLSSLMTTTIGRVKEETDICRTLPNSAEFNGDSHVSNNYCISNSADSCNMHVTNEDEMNYS